MADTNTIAVQKLYVAYFGRPADTGGLQYWTNALANNPNALAEMSRQFGLSQEYRVKYAGMDNRAIVNEVYDNLFGRAAEEGGLNYWSDLMNRGVITIDAVVNDVSRAAAGNSDGVVFAGKANAAAVFTQRLDLPSEVAAYAGPAAIQVAVDFVDTVRNLQSAAAAQDPGYVDSWISRMVSGGTGMEDVTLVGSPTGVEPPLF
ncbi:DUF4214 domain-containing protein [Massilia niastensis]|uniref:DUF4214 domain-containing protein n=1 Tax=Massilia niastensis TaxID=544911 RepID=UPI00037D4537|nr:DUF4214 domain-containing protein [Massilia niastensis]